MGWQVYGLILKLIVKILLILSCMYLLSIYIYKVLMLILIATEISVDI
jgi:hypothetical protein